MAAPRRFRICSLETLRWVIAHRAMTPWYLARYGRLLRLRLLHRSVICEGLVFLDRGVSVRARPGYGRVIFGPWVHVGAGTALRAHSGTLRVGAKAIIARDVTVNCHLDVCIGVAALIADQVWIGDFDHCFDSTEVPIKDQGIATAPVIIGDDVWLGTRSTVLRGVRVGAGSVVGAHTVVTRDVDPATVVAGVPGRVLRRRSTARAAPVRRRWRHRGP